jgi:hypothetical protein
MPENRRRGGRARALGAALAIGLGLALASAGVGDPASAKTLLESAKDALQQKKLDLALSMLAKAREEDPALLEVGYWAGMAQEKKGDAQAALREYRTFRDAAGVAEGGGSLTKEQSDLLKKTHARLAALAPGESEDAKLRAILAADLFGVAKSREKDRGAAALALEALLEGDPQNAEVRGALARVRAVPRMGEFPLPPQLQDVTTWHDMIAKPLFGTIGGWEYRSPGCVIEGRGNYGAAEPLILGQKYAIDLEMRVVATHGERWSAGWGLQTRPAVFYALFRPGDAAAMFGTENSDSYKPLATIAITSPQIGVWHRMTLLVEGTGVLMWIDGGKPSTFVVDGIQPEKTQVTMVYYDCKFELRTFRWTRLK